MTFHQTLTCDTRKKLQNLAINLKTMMAFRNLSYQDLSHMMETSRSKISRLVNPGLIGNCNMKDVMALIVTLDFPKDKYEKLFNEIMIFDDFLKM
jgi:predicted XRE-type DNA-binding protein